MCANDELDPSDMLQPDNLPGDVSPLLSEFEEPEGYGLPSSDDESEDEESEDWIDEMDLEAMHPKIEADVTREDLEAMHTEIGAEVTHEDNQPPALNQAQQAEVERSQGPDLSLEVDQFGGMAGRPIRTGGPTAGGIYQEKVGHGDQPTNLYAPFSSQIDWEFAKWAKLRGPTSTAVTDLLNIPGVSPWVFLFQF